MWKFLLIVLVLNGLIGIWVLIEKPEPNLIIPSTFMVIGGILAVIELITGWLRKRIIKMMYQIADSEFWKNFYSTYIKRDY